MRIIALGMEEETDMREVEKLVRLGFSRIFAKRVRRKVYSKTSEVSRHAPRREYQQKKWGNQDFSFDEKGEFIMTCWRHPNTARWRY